MQVLCIAAEVGSIADANCPLCGQGYVIYYSRSDKTEQEASLKELLLALEQQHGCSNGPHQVKAFNLPSWNGHPRASAAAVISGAYGTLRSEVK